MTQKTVGPLKLEPAEIAMWLKYNLITLYIEYLCCQEQRGTIFQLGSQTYLCVHCVH